MAKKFYMVLDCETIADARVPFDVACMIVDRKGIVYDAYNFLVEEVMTDPTLRFILAKDKYSKGKAPYYLDNSTIPCKPFAAIVADLNNLIAEYDNAVVVAYNAQFDFNVLNNYAKQLLGAPCFADDVTVWDLWHMALNTICDSGNYVHWCIANNCLTKTGNISTSAESVFSYIFKDVNFKEAHLAMEDCDIERLILQTIFDRHQALTTHFCAPVNSRPVWQKRCKLH